MIIIKDNKVTTNDEALVIRRKGSYVTFKECVLCKGETKLSFEEITEEQNHKDLTAYIKSIQ